MIYNAAVKGGQRQPLHKQEANDDVLFENHNIIVEQAAFAT